MNGHSDDAHPARNGAPSFGSVADLGDAPVAGHAVAGPSTEVTSNGYPEAPYVHPHNERIVDHLYNTGFQMGEYADTILHAHQNMYRLHAIILSRSPYLAHLMSTTPIAGGMRTIYVPLESFPEVTDQAALGYLYSAVSLRSLAPGNARAVLAAGCLLGGMDDLCHCAYAACRDAITVDTIVEWVAFADRLPAPSEPAAAHPHPHQTLFGPYAPQLRADVFHFLVAVLPGQLDAQAGSAGTAAPGPGPSHAQGAPAVRRSGRETLLEIFSRVPFDLFKNAVESPSFQIGSDQERFKFAKAAVGLRRRRGGGWGEETVVLAFGGGQVGSAVHVTRKVRKRALFKVGDEGLDRAREDGAGGGGGI